MTRVPTLNISACLDTMAPMIAEVVRLRTIDRHERLSAVSEASPPASATDERAGTRRRRGRTSAAAAF